MGVYRAFNYTNEVGVSNQNATLATVVRSAGYQAHAVGKWHIGGGKPGYVC